LFREGGKGTMDIVKEGEKGDEDLSGDKSA